MSNVSLGLVLRVIPHHKTWSSEVDEVLLGYTPPSLTFFFLSSAVSLLWTFVPHLVKSLVLHTLTEWLNATLQSDLKTPSGSEFAQSHGSLKQPCTSAFLPGESLQQKSMALMHDLQLREPTLCLSLCPVGRTFQPFCKAFTGPYCGREGKLLENIFQAWPSPSLSQRMAHTVDNPHCKSPSIQVPSTSMLFIHLSVQDPGFLFDLKQFTQRIPWLPVVRTLLCDNK